MSDESKANPSDAASMEASSGDAEATPECPMRETHDKFDEAHYFLEQMMSCWHEPQPFRWSLNAFLQALRNVTFFLQKEMKEYPGFAQWYEAQQAQLRADPLLKAFVEGRNLVVKERNLFVKSTAHIGYFRYRKPKLGITFPVPAHVPSRWLLENQAPKLGFVDSSHAFIGEEYGVERAWIVEELGQGNVLPLCDQAWSKIGHVLSAAHALTSHQWQPPPPHGHDPAQCALLTETDVDPSLIDKWGWND